MLTEMLKTFFHNRTSKTKFRYTANRAMLEAAKLQDANHTNRGLNLTYQPPPVSFLKSKMVTPNQDIETQNFIVAWEKNGFEFLGMTSQDFIKIQNLHYNLPFMPNAIAPEGFKNFLTKEFNNCLDERSRNALLWLILKCLSHIVLNSENLPGTKINITKEADNNFKVMITRPVPNTNQPKKGSTSYQAQYIYNSKLSQLDWITFETTDQELFFNVIDKTKAIQNIGDQLKVNDHQDREREYDLELLAQMVKSDKTEETQKELIQKILKTEFKKTIQNIDAQLNNKNLQDCDREHYLDILAKMIKSAKTEKDQKKIIHKILKTEFKKAKEELENVISTQIPKETNTPNEKIIEPQRTQQISPNEKLKKCRDELWQIYNESNKNPRNIQIKKILVEKYEAYEQAFITASLIESRNEYMKARDTYKTSASKTTKNELNKKFQAYKQAYRNNHLQNEMHFFNQVITANIQEGFKAINTATPPSLKNNAAEEEISEIEKRADDIVSSTLYMRKAKDLLSDKDPQILISKAAVMPSKDDPKTFTEEEKTILFEKDLNTRIKQTKEMNTLINTRFKGTLFGSAKAAKTVVNSDPYTKLIIAIGIAMIITSPLILVTGGFHHILLLGLAVGTLPLPPLVLGEGIKRAYNHKHWFLKEASHLEQAVQIHHKEILKPPLIIT